MRRLIGVVCATAMLVLATTDVSAKGPWNLFFTHLQPENEVPAVSSPAKGSFWAVVRDNDTIEYRLTFSNLQADVRQAHIHFAQPNVNGGIMLWLCGSATNPGPGGTQVCPQSGTITGVLAATDVQTTTTQGIGPAEFGEVAKAIRNGLAYVNVHTAQSTGGEIRGQLRPWFFGFHN